MTKKYEIVEGGETLLVTEKENGEIRYTNRQGEFHRTLGPAVVWEDGSKYWYQHGLLHRIDGPAVIYPTGTKHWYQNDQRHRLDGPAVVWADGTKLWYIRGERIITREQFDDIMPSSSTTTISEIEQHACTCSLQTVMARGCACGGK